MKYRSTTAVFLLLLGGAVSAQDRGATIGGSASAANMESRTEVAYAGTFGYRFSRVVGMEIEAIFVPAVRSPFPANPVVIQSASSAFADVSRGSVQIYPVPTYDNPGGRIVIFSNGVRIDIPTTTSRLTPYFVAGGGMASVRRTVDFTYPYPILVTQGSPSSPISPGIPVSLRPITEHITSSSSDLALTLGGGLGVRVASQLAVDADLRLFRLLGQQDRNLGRFGVGVRYRF